MSNSLGRIVTYNGRGTHSFPAMISNTPQSYVSYSLIKFFRPLKIFKCNLPGGSDGSFGGLLLAVVELPDPALLQDDAMDDVLRPFVLVEPPLDPRKGLLISGV